MDITVSPLPTSLNKSPIMAGSSGGQLAPYLERPSPGIQVIRYRAARRQYTSEHVRPVFDRPSGIDRLPDEILIMIFNELGESITDHLPAWAASQVSRRWRRVVLATPRLWAQMRVILPSQHSNRAEYVNLLMERSYPWLITVHIVVTEHATPENCQGIINIMDRLATRSSILHVQGSIGARCGFILPSFLFRGLRDLELIGLDISGEPDWMQALAAALSPCRGLRKLSLYRFQPMNIAPNQAFLDQRRHNITLPDLLELGLVGGIAHGIGSHLASSPKHMTIDLENVPVVALIALGPSLASLRTVFIVGSGVYVHQLRNLFRLVPLLETVVLTCTLLRVASFSPLMEPPLLNKLELGHCDNIRAVLDLIDGLDAEYTRDHLRVTLFIDQATSTRDAEWRELIRAKVQDLALVEPVSGRKGGCHIWPVIKLVQP